LFPKDTQIANKYMKRWCSTSLIIKEMQIKTTTTYQLTTDSIAIMKKTRSNKYLQRCGAKGTLIYCWWEYKLVQPLWKAVWRFLKKLKIDLPYDLAITLLGIYLKKTKALTEKSICIPMFVAALKT
ncbi:LORF2 protein, partial [Crocuta crocuta]